MGTFQHTPDGTIVINGTTSFPLAFFVTVETAYALPSGMTTQYYEQDVIHYASDGFTENEYDIPWTDGDSYITNVATYISAYAAYLNSSITLEQAQAAKITEVEDFGSTIKEGHVIVTISATPCEFFSDEDFFNELGKYLIVCDPVVPIGFYVNDVNYAQISISVASDVEAIMARIANLYYLTDLNVDTHRTAINALGTVAAVQAYNYSAGWQTVPY